MVFPAIPRPAVSLGEPRNGASACRNHSFPTPDLRASLAPRESAWSAPDASSCRNFPARFHGPVRIDLSTPSQAEDKTLTVFAAASMKNALDEADAAYTAKTGVKVSASYAASSALAKQIEQGAPADIFVSADTDWMEYAIGKKNINVPTRVNLLGNSHRADRAEGFQDRQRDDRTRALIWQNSPATARSRPATSRRCRSANTPRPRSRSSAHGRPRSRNSRWPRACARRWRWWRAARPCSASSIRPTPRSSPASRSSARSRPIPIRRSSIRSRRHRPRSRMPPVISPSCSRLPPRRSSRNTVSSS